ncbi:hypothetical protein [Acidisoma sp. 7E03]
MIAAIRSKRMLAASAAGATALLACLTLSATPAHAWWRGGVWVAGPGPAYWGPPPVVYPPPVVVAPPPVYYAPPPVVYAPPAVVYPAPPAPYFPPQPQSATAAARSCITPTMSCAMTVARAPGSGCYCSDSTGDRSYGTAQ